MTAGKVVVGWGCVVAVLVVAVLVLSPAAGAVSVGEAERHSGAAAVSLQAHAVGGAGSAQPEARRAAREAGSDFGALSAAGNNGVGGLWSDGATMWVSDWGDGKVYGYSLASKARDASQDFDALLAAGNDDPVGLWSDGTTMWVTDWDDAKVYAYDLASKARDASQDFDSLDAAGNDDPAGLWSDGTTMWVSDWGDGKVYGYDLASKARDASQDFDSLGAAGNDDPRGLWSDGSTMWIADPKDDAVYAYDLASKAKAHTASRNLDMLLDVGNTAAHGLWSDGSTMWISDSGDDAVYAYRMQSAPGVVRASVIGWELTLKFDEALDASSVPAPSAFAVVADGVAVSVSEVSVSGREVVLALASPVEPGDAVTVGYTPPASDGELRDPDSHGVAAFSGHEVANHRPAQHIPESDFDTLTAADNTYAFGFWSDGTTMWASDYARNKVYAYDMESKLRVAHEDFDLGLNNMMGLWSDGTTIWAVNNSTDGVLSQNDDKVYAYDMASKQPDGSKHIDSLQPSWAQPRWVGYGTPSDLRRDASKDLNTLRAAGNTSPSDLWSDGSTMWIADRRGKVFTYDLESGASTGSTKYDTAAHGLWSDGSTIWLANYPDRRVYAYDLASSERVASKDVDLRQAAGSLRPTALWSDGSTLWVSYHNDPVRYAPFIGAVQAFRLPLWPVVVDASVSGSVLTLTFDEVLEASSVPAGSAFEVVAGGVPVSVLSVLVSGPEVALTLASAPVPGAAVSVGYALPASGALRDADGHPALGFSGREAVFVARALSGDSTLSGLGVYPGSVLFDAEKQDYEVSVGNDVAEVTVRAVASDPGASVAFKLNGAAQSDGRGLGLGVGVNRIEVVVTAEDGETTRTYTVAVTRAADEVAPVVTVGGPSGVQSAPFVVRFEFSEAVSGFGAGDVSVVGGSLGALAVQSAGRAWTALVTPGAGWDGMVVVSVAEGAAVDAANNPSVAAVGSFVVDVAAPALESATVRGSELTLKFDEALLFDASSVPAPSAFAVLAGGVAVPVASVSVSEVSEVSEATVVLGLGAAVRHGDAVTVSYEPGPGRLRDRFGNRVAAFGPAVADNATAASSDASLAALGVSPGSVAFSPSTPNYEVSVGNDVAEVTVTAAASDPRASVAFKLNDVPQSSGKALGLGVGVNKVEVVVTAEDGETTKTYTVAVTRAADEVAPVVTVGGPSGVQSAPFVVRFEFSEAVSGFGAGDVSVVGGSLGALAVQSAGRAWTALVTPRAGWDGMVAVSVAAGAATDAANNPSVAAVESFAVDVAAPRLESASVRGSKLVLVFDEALDASSVPAPSAFAVLADGVAVPEVSVSSVSEATVVLGLGAAVRHGDAVTVSYEPGPGRLRDRFGNRVAAFGPTAAVNATAASSDASLAALGVSPGSVAFSPSTPNYEVSVGNDVAEVTVTAAASDPRASVAFKLNDAAHSDGKALELGVGVNRIEVEVTAEDGETTKTYTVAVTRAEAEPAPGVAPDTPDVPTGEVTAKGQAQVDWNDVEDATYYQLRTWISTKWIVAPSTEISIVFDGSAAVVSNLPNGGYLYFSVRAGNASGLSDWSDYMTLINPER